MRFSYTVSCSFETFRSNAAHLVATMDFPVIKAVSKIPIRIQRMKNVKTIGLGD